MIYKIHKSGSKQVNVKKIAFACSFAFLFTLNVAAEVCRIDVNKYKLQAPVDCINCQNDAKTPVDKIESPVHSVINFMTHENEQRTTVRKLKVYDHFLSSKKNKERCSNYKAISSEYFKEFQKHLVSCEQGPKKKQERICAWVLPQHNTKITEAIFSAVTETHRGVVRFKRGKYMDDLESPVRAQEAWCRKVEAKYENKVYLGCNQLKNLVREFDLGDRTTAAVKEAREAAQARATEAELREKTKRDGCKYFETHEPTILTQGIYLQCTL